MDRKTQLKHDALSEIKPDQHHSQKHDLNGKDHDGKLSESKISYPNPPLHSHIGKIKAKIQGEKETGEQQLLEFIPEGGIQLSLFENKQYGKIQLTISGSSGGGGGSGTPATTVESAYVFGQTAVVGTGSNYAREDHDHGSIVAAVTSESAYTLGQTATVGTSSLASRADHRHGSVSGNTTTESSYVLDQIAVVGTSSLVSKADHIHGAVKGATTSVSAYTYGQTALVGTSSYAAREDHRHGTPGGGWTAAGGPASANPYRFFDHFVGTSLRPEWGITAGAASLTSLEGGWVQLPLGGGVSNLLTLGNTTPNFYRASMPHFQARCYVDSVAANFGISLETSGGAVALARAALHLAYGNDWVLMSDNGAGTVHVHTGLTVVIGEKYLIDLWLSGAVMGAQTWNLSVTPESTMIPVVVSDGTRPPTNAPVRPTIYSGNGGAGGFAVDWYGIEADFSQVPA